MAMLAELKLKIAEMKPVLLSSELLDLHPGPFTMSFGFDLESLSDSIRHIGLVNSPVVMESSRGDVPDIISGYRRITALRAVGIDPIPCRILRKNEVSPLKAFFLNLYDNLATRNFNPVEKGMALGRLNRLLPQEDTLLNYMDLFGLPKNPATLDTYMLFESDLDDATKRMVAQGLVSVQTAGMLLTISPPERDAISGLLKNLNFNMNQQRQLIEYLIDISIKSKKGIHELIQRKTFQEILTNDALNAPQKNKAFLEALRAERYPSLVRAEKAYRTKVSRLQLPKDVRIQAPPYFESSRYRMEISFRHGKGLKKTIDRLSKNRDLENIKDPWDEDH